MRHREIPEIVLARWRWCQQVQLCQTAQTIPIWDPVGAPPAPSADP